MVLFKFYQLLFWLERSVTNNLKTIYSRKDVLNSFRKNAEYKYKNYIIKDNIKIIEYNLKLKYNIMHYTLYQNGISKLYCWRVGISSLTLASSPWLLMLPLIRDWTELIEWSGMLGLVS